MTRQIGGGIDFFTPHGITKVYGSYGNRTTTSIGAVQVAAWNVALHAAGIESQFLMSENSWLFLTNRPSFFINITERVADFNNTYQEARNHVDAVLTPGFPVYADLPVWFDSIPGSIGWSNPVERDQWFSDVATHLTGITLMPFERLTFSSINNAVDWERTNITGASVRIALEADDDFWPTEGHFFLMRDQLESAYGDHQATDFQSYELFREMIADRTAEPAIAHLSLPAGSPIITHVNASAEPSFIYVLETSADLCRWRGLESFETSTPRDHDFPGELNEARNFWRISRYPLQP